MKKPWKNLTTNADAARKHVFHKKTKNASPVFSRVSTVLIWQEIVVQNEATHAKCYILMLRWLLYSGFTQNITFFVFNGTEIAHNWTMAPICLHFQEAVSRWLLIGFQKVLVFLISTLRDNSIGVNFGSTWGQHWVDFGVSIFEKPRFSKIENFKILKS